MDGLTQSEVEFCRGGWGAGVVGCVRVGRGDKSALRTQDHICHIAEILGDRPVWRIHDIRINLPVAEQNIR